MAQVLSAFHLHTWSSSWAPLLDSTSPLSTSSSSSCLSPSSSSTSSCSLSSSTRRTWQTRAAPRGTRVRTLMTSSTLQPHLDASEIYARRLNAKDMITPKSGEHFMFPVTDGTNKIAKERVRILKIHFNGGPTCKK